MPIWYWQYLSRIDSFRLQSSLLPTELARDHLRQREKYEVIGGVISPAHDLYRKPNVHIENSNHRCNMIKLTLDSSNWIRISEWEISQTHWTSTLQVLEHHQVTNKIVLCAKSSLASKYLIFFPLIYHQQKCLDNFLNSADKNMATWMPSSIRRCCREQKNIKIKLLCGTDFFEAMTNVQSWPVRDVNYQKQI